MEIKLFIIQLSKFTYYFLICVRLHVCAHRPYKCLQESIIILSNI